MPSPHFNRDEIRDLSHLSPFELKNTFIDLAQTAQEDEPGQKGTSSVQMLNAGRGNPNWVATGPREAFHALGYFSLTESKRVWAGDDLGGMPEERGIADRFDAFLRHYPQLPGVDLLGECVAYAVEHLGFDKNAFIHELADSSIGDNYPVPARMLAHAEAAVRTYLNQEILGSSSDSERLQLFATEGGTAAMCYIFDSLAKNRLLKQGDRIALMVPVFTPYIEIPELEEYDFDVIHVQAHLSTEHGVRRWRYPDSELEKLADPSVKMVCLVNPSNPPSVALDPSSAKKIETIVTSSNPDLIIVTDDVYGTFVEGFSSIAELLPSNTLLVYSYSKHYGATGWRLGVIGLNEENIIDDLIARLPDDERESLRIRYSSLNLHPDSIRFIDRLVADSRQVALNHTAGLSLPQQTMMTLFSLFALSERGQKYKADVRKIVRKRLDLLLEGAGMHIDDDPLRAGYYIELNLLAEARRTHGDDFAQFVEDNYEPIDPLLRLAERTHVVLLNGGGFDGPEWSVRVSLANLDALDYLKIGHHLRKVLDTYVDDWQSQTR
ncbi:bifunctional aspartate transaminase/aspartate 4-decarboxylase [Brevibacterium aurantiacum]|uniref:Aminotransferase n=1 Tax=Brevibacterium aurantiacum TaxID=273384 RepID=A0A3T0DA28_BREAU|nr:bifunctional aspartate transaminase/aspartate 4-decarboxylase [Brevibacterium aurantiacum]AZT92081.1 aspartate 4-decarboxylase [Brevibacterium aurantiacum]